jgi:hypothetical protein
MATLTGLCDDIRACTNHDSDTQVTDVQLTVWINKEYYRLRRILAEVAPSLFQNQVSFTISSGNTYAVVATDYDRVYRLERLVNGTEYEPLGLADALDPESVPDGLSLAFLERGTTLEIYPSTSAAGSYRLTYTTKPAALSGGSDSCTVPEGAEEVIVQRVSARVRVRFEEDPSIHVALANEALSEVRSYLQKRYGVHPEGLRNERRR